MNTYFPVVVYLTATSLLRVFGWLFRLRRFLVGVLLVLKEVKRSRRAVYVDWESRWSASAVKKNTKNLVVFRPRYESGVLSVRQHGGRYPQFSTLDANMHRPPVLCCHTSMAWWEPHSVRWCNGNSLGVFRRSEVQILIELSWLRFLWFSGFLQVNAGLFATSTTAS